MSKNKIAIIHIGLHKTASTTLQHFFSNYEKKFNNNNIFFPLSGRCQDGIAHHNLALELCNHNSSYSVEFGSFSDLKDELLKKQYKNIILSSEDFEFEHDETGKNPFFLKKFFQNLGYSTYVIAFVREQHEYLNSEYAEQMKYGIHSSQFSNFLKSELSERRYNYPELFKHWKLNFGEKLIILPFEKVQWGMPIEMFFLSNLPPTLSLEHFEKIQSCFVNKRLSSKAIEILRIVTHLCFKLDLPLNEKESAIRNAHLYIAKMNDSHESFSGLNKTNVRIIRNYFLDSNRMLAQTYMKNKNSLFIRTTEELNIKENLFTFFINEKKYLPELKTIINYCFHKKHISIFSKRKLFHS